MSIDIVLSLSSSTPRYLYGGTQVASTVRWKSSSSRTSADNARVWSLIVADYECLTCLLKTSPFQRFTIISNTAAEKLREVAIHRKRDFASKARRFMYTRSGLDTPWYTYVAPTHYVHHEIAQHATWLDHNIPAPRSLCMTRLWRWSRDIIFQTLPLFSVQHWKAGSGLGTRLRSNYYVVVCADTIIFNQNLGFAIKQLGIVPDLEEW